MEAPKNNQFAKKSEHEKTDTQVGIRCRSEDKARWLKKAEAEGRTLSEWIVNKLNQAS
ncbi:MAG: hypothetical protein PHT48_09690 [Dechloromonas sp.]|nr:hypothetical protein [Dechloromonas sp.]